VIIHRLHDPEMAERRRRTRKGLRSGKPKVREVLRKSGLSMKELRERAGLGKGPVRGVICGRDASDRTARAIVEAIGPGLSEAEARALEEEPRGAPETISEKVSKKVP